MFTNKHIITALLVSPLLAVLAWFAMGALLDEPPREAEPGQAYPLVESSNCRYDSQQCDLYNEDLRLSLSLQSDTGRPILGLTSSHRLDAVLMAVAASEDDSFPTSMLREDSEGRHWVLQLQGVPTDAERIHLVVQSRGSQWYADTSTAFLAPYRAATGDE